MSGKMRQIPPIGFERMLQLGLRGLKMLPQTKLERLPRMADFALWATACETAIWPAGTFMAAYCRNRDDAIETVIEGDVVATTVRAMMLAQAGGGWTGTATVLLGALSDFAVESVTKSKAWPRTARTLSGRLRRVAPVLRKIGIDIAHTKEGRGAARARTITITATDTFLPELERVGNFASPPSPPSPPITNGNENNDLSGDPKWGRKTSGDAKSKSGDAKNSPRVRANPLKTNDVDDGDGGDANLPSQSGPQENRQERWRKRL